MIRLSYSSYSIVIGRAYHIYRSLSRRDYSDSESNKYLVPFKCIIRPRTPAAEALIGESVDEEG